jgi:phosphoserine phosphatase RsbU/P
MNVLVVEDDPTYQKYLDRMLKKWGYQVDMVSTGEAALSRIKNGKRPDIAILDRILPDQDGTVVSRELRLEGATRPVYIIYLTVRNEPLEVVEGLQLGGDDYVSKPFHVDELRQRLEVGKRIITLQKNLIMKARDLERALSEIKTLHGFLPICSYCKSVRTDNNYWQKLETYLKEQTDVQISHGICPNCIQSHFPDEPVTNPA